MSKAPQADTRLAEASRQLKRMWLLWGIVPLVIAAVLVFACSAGWASPSKADEHVVERGFQAMLAICGGLFLIGFWLDGKWTSTDRLAARIWQAAGGAQSAPKRPQLAAQADVAFQTITASAAALSAIGGAIAVAAVISVWAGLNLSQACQILLLGLCYQIFILSRHPYYEEVLTAASEGELALPETDANHRDKK